MPKFLPNQTTSCNLNHFDIVLLSAQSPMLASQKLVVEGRSCTLATGVRAYAIGVRSIRTDDENSHGIHNTYKAS